LAWIEARRHALVRLMVELGRFGAVEADIIVGRLASEGIEAVASGRTLASLYPIAVLVLVEQRDLAVAQRIVRAAA
jgi:hypothetical protein